jgi:hypothetical protein
VLIGNAAAALQGAACDSEQEGCPAAAGLGGLGDPGEGS